MPTSRLLVALALLAQSAEGLRLVPAVAMQPACPALSPLVLPRTPTVEMGRVCHAPHHFPPPFQTLTPPAASTSSQGDKRTVKGKRRAGSFGNVRPRNGEIRRRSDGPTPTVKVKMPTVAAVDTEAVAAAEAAAAEAAAAPVAEIDAVPEVQRQRLPEVKAASLQLDVHLRKDDPKAVDFLPPRKELVGEPLDVDKVAWMAEREEPAPTEKPAPAPAAAAGAAEEEPVTPGPALAPDGFVWGDTY